LVQLLTDSWIIPDLLLRFLQCFQGSRNLAKVQKGFDAELVPFHRKGIQLQGLIQTLKGVLVVIDAAGAAGLRKEYPEEVPIQTSPFFRQPERLMRERRGPRHKERA
jgi:hypothetical protein